MAKNKPHIVFTGGGTAGHVIPNIALIETLGHDWKMDYIGSAAGIEKKMISALGISYHAVKSGKLRRYFSWRNFIDPFNILIGILQSYWLIRRLKPDIVFSKGGFIAFPVVVGAWLNRIPVIAHESDLTPGLANRMSFPFVKCICVAFAGTKKRFKNPQKVVVTGTPIRNALFQGNKQKGLALCGFDSSKPCVLVMGGSQGAGSINKIIEESLPTLLEQFQIIHLCGRGKVDETLAKRPGYCPFEYANETLADLFAASQYVISRSGANTLYEILALDKPHILIPLSIRISRGDQIQNARYFERQGISMVIEEENLTSDSLLAALKELLKQEKAIKAKIAQLDIQSSARQIAKLIEEAL